MDGRPSIQGPADASGAQPAHARTADALRWRRVYPGEERQLSAARRWVKSLLPPCPACDELISVVTELASNAIAHTASGQGGWFAVELTWHPAVVRVAVADCGGPAQPHIIYDSNGERGRGLLLVRGLAIRSGYVGDRRGRLVWADISWPQPETADSDNRPDPHDAAAPYWAAIRDGEAALNRRFAGVPAWFGHATLSWWALADNDTLITAPTAHELAGQLFRHHPNSGQAVTRQATPPRPLRPAPLVPAPAPAADEPALAPRERSAAW